MARSPTTPRKAVTTTQSERTAKRLARQQKQLEKELLNEMTIKVVHNAGKMVKYSDIKKLKPLTDTQSRFFQAWANDDAIGYLLYGSAGTGKTFAVLYHAMLEVLRPEATYKKIIIVRSCVQSRDVGFLKGDIAEKYEQYELPYHDICADLTNNKDAYSKLKETGKIVFLSTSFLRGSTFNDSIVVFDECQNTTFPEFSTVLSRLGTNSKICVLGDTKQDDLTKNKNEVSGFRAAIDVMNSMSDFRSFKFNSDDIVRSDFVKAWILACEKLGL